MDGITAPKNKKNSTSITKNWKTDKKEFSKESNDTQVIQNEKVDIKKLKVTNYYHQGYKEYKEEIDRQMAKITKYL